ncbi:uncharacterized protein LAESUDRAFT_746712 [Laetiporus sulphureus 93-53]|uniref:Telomere-associated protein Rif1 N-terminal domain-containing protein n=1 Tax=Laetiporus sulphureus 93-53 TaxID=1314785 RepID=A0A165HMB3_9APHY|nr:uncharacterized protein LAESUDRAFT_746712 [Laetiporus sulphureus 93-53]KZT11922.1 hypothetical protein LAESUDRAFT_746712 [Laetiporus sulphureus 93-53]
MTSDSTPRLDSKRIVSLYRGPLATLQSSLSSDHLSYHDIAEAYNTLSARLKMIFPFLPNDRRLAPSLDLLGQHADVIVKCLRRDIHCASVEPIPDSSQSDRLTEQSASTLEANYREEDIKYAKDMSLVCQHALHLLSDILRLPALSSLLSEANIFELLDLVSKVASAHFLPIPSEQKIRALAYLALSSMRLPVATLRARRSQLTSVCKSAMERSGNEICVLDGLKMFCNLMRMHASVFLNPFANILPLVLAGILSSSTRVQTHAADALGAYVLALSSCMSSSYEHVRNVIKYHVSTFIEAAAKKLKGPRPLSDFLARTIQTSGKDAAGYRQPWAFVTLSCIITLSEENTFTHEPTLQLVIELLNVSAHPKRLITTFLHRCVWRCLVWALSHIEQQAESTQRRKGISTDRTHRAFQFVNQEHRGEIPILLIDTLMNSAAESSRSHTTTPEARELSKVLEVVNASVNDKDDPVHMQGRAILARLTSAIGSSSVAVQDHVRLPKTLVAELFDGTILHSNKEQLNALAANFALPDVTVLLQLTEAEIIQNWDALLDIWMQCVRRSINTSERSFVLSGDLMQTWQSLLLAQAQLTQEHGHLTTVPDVSRRVLSTLHEILTSNDVFHTSSKSQCVALTLVSQLWKVVKSVFAASWLAGMAESLLFAVVSQQFDLEDDDTKACWGELSAALICTSSTELLYKLVISQKKQTEGDLKRYLWFRIATAWVSCDMKPSWHDQVYTLSFPLCSWSMSNDELEIWKRLLEIAVKCAQASSVHSAQVLRTLMSHITEAPERSFSNPNTIPIMLSHLELHETDTIPDKLLAQVDNFLSDVYGIRQEQYHNVLEIFRLLAQVFQRCPRTLLGSVVCSISDGLSVWIRDESEILLAQEYNDIIVRLYQIALDLMRELPFSVDTLHSLAPFFVSAFCRIPPPALGPIAFRTFWMRIQPGLGSSTSILPDDIKQVLLTFHVVFGDSVPLDVSDASQSTNPENEEDEVVPETQGADESQPREHPTMNIQPLDEGGKTEDDTEFTDARKNLGSNIVSTLHSAHESSIVSAKTVKVMPEVVNDDSTTKETGKNNAQDLQRLRKGSSTVPDDRGIRPGGSSISAPDCQASGSGPSWVGHSSTRIIPTSVKGKKRVLEDEGRPRAECSSLYSKTVGPKRLRLSSASQQEQREHAENIAGDKVEHQPVISAEDTIHQRSHSVRGPDAFRHTADEPPTGAGQRNRMSQSPNFSPAHRPQSLSPEIPIYNYAEDPAEAHSASSPPSDDYATWEAEVDPDEVKHVQRDTSHAPDQGGVSSKPLLQSQQLKPYVRTYYHNSLIDESEVIPSSQGDEELPIYPETHYSRISSTSGRLNVLRRALTDLRKDVSPMSMDEFQAAKKLLHDMESVVADRCSRGVRGSDADVPMQDQSE